MDNYYGNICYCRRCNGVVHTIKKGDTLYLISKYYKVPIGEIMGANRNINVYNLQIGDEICIPVRRPEPRENDINDTGMNNMSRSMGNAMNSDEIDVSSEPYNVPDNSVEEASAQVSDINKLKVSELIGEKDMTVEELARMLKKYM